MEKEILNEIRARIDDLQKQIDALRSHIEELAVEPAPQEFTEPVDVFLEVAPEPVPAPEPEVAPVPVPEPEVAPAPAVAPEPEAVPEDLPEPAAAPAPEPASVPEPEPEPAPEPEPVPEPAPARPALDYQWAKDIPGGPVTNIISGISLNDRVLLINTLFKEDPILFQKTIGAFNAMSCLNEAVDYVASNFPSWNLSSDIVYRLMMAVRRKLK